MGMDVGHIYRSDYSWRLKPGTETLRLQLRSDPIQQKEELRKSHVEGIPYGVARVAELGTLLYVVTSPFSPVLLGLYLNRIGIV